jgi:hypothetical protein
VVTWRFQVDPDVPRHVESGEFAEGPGEEALREELVESRVGRHGALAVLGAPPDILPGEAGAWVLARLDLSEEGAGAFTRLPEREMGISPKSDPPESAAWVRQAPGGGRTERSSSGLCW